MDFTAQDKESSWRNVFGPKLEEIGRTNDTGTSGSSRECTHSKLFLKLLMITLWHCGVFFFFIRLLMYTWQQTMSHIANSYIKMCYFYTLLTSFLIKAVPLLLGFIILYESICERESWTVSLLNIGISEPDCYVGVSSILSGFNEQ